nr:uncharacterized protein LOC104098686 [Nicotiana tomentosiformis]
MNTFRYNGASHNAIYLRAFPFSLKDDANQWLRSLPTGSIRTWEEMTTMFLEKHFSAAKIGRMRKEIHHFSQGEGETVFEAWKRFKELLWRCPHNGMEQWMQLQDFWDRLNLTSRRLLNSAVTGPLMKKTPKVIVTLLNELSVDHGDRRRSSGVHQVESSVAMQAQFSAMAKDIKQLTIAQVQNQPQVGCNMYGLGHPTHECQATAEEVNAVWNFNRGNYQCGNNYNTMGQRHSAIREHGAAIKEIGTGFRNMETQVGQLATLLSERIPGILPTDTERNPKETVNVVTLRSGQVLKDPTPVQKDLELEKESGERLKKEVDKKKKGDPYKEEESRGDLCGQAYYNTSCFCT